MNTVHSKITTPTVCSRCRGDGVLPTLIRDTIITRSCPDCRCSGCGQPALGMCDDCWAADWLTVDTAHRRAADR